MAIVTTRVQLSMYVPEPEASELESVRRVLDPIQSGLIPAHVTLCREDELTLMDSGELASRLADAHARSVTLHFGRPRAFDEHGVLLPCIAREEDFRSLREQVLGSRNIRYQAPHITLAHPRNPKSAGNCLTNADVLRETISVTFTSVKLIEQVGNTAWRVLKTFELRRVNA